MEKKYEAHVEIYELLLAEMKSLENDHQNELSRVNQSSTTAISSANVDVLRLEKQIDTLRREKEEQEIELRRVEDLLMRHTKSEMQLKRKVQQYKDEAAALAVTITAASEQKKNQEALNEENLQKINNLEKELIKLQFQQPKIKQSEIIDDIDQKVKISFHPFLLIFRVFITISLYFGLPMFLLFSKKIYRAGNIRLFYLFIFY